MSVCVSVRVFLGGGGHHYRAFHWRLLSFSWSVSLASNHTGSFADVPDTDGKASSTQDLAVSAAATGAAGAGAGVGATFNAKGGSSASTRPSDSGASGASESAYDRSAPIQLAQAGPHGFMHTIVSAARYDVRCLRAAVMSYPPPFSHLLAACCVLRAACCVCVCFPGVESHQSQQTRPTPRAPHGHRPHPHHQQESREEAVWQQRNVQSECVCCECVCVCCA